jgi:hypothetical protein
MANSPIMTSLPEYVEQRRLPLIAAAVLGGDTAKLFNLQTDVKTSAALNLLATDVEFGDGSACGWDEAGTQTLSQRILNTGLIKINMAYCDKVMLKYWTQYQVRVAAGDKTLPFEEYFINEVIKDVKAKLEKAIFQGDKTSQDDNLNKFDGLIKILGAESSVVSFTKGANVAASVLAAYMAIPEEALDGASILIGADDFREYVQALVAQNLYHYDPNVPVDVVYIPGTNVAVRKANGLNGTHKLIAGQLDKNFFYGCDMVNDEEKFEFWYSKDNREFRLAIEFNAGVQVAFPDMVVMGDTK